MSIVEVVAGVSLIYIAITFIGYGLAYALLPQDAPDERWAISPGLGVAVVVLAWWVATWVHVSALVIVGIFSGLCIYAGWRAARTRPRPQAALIWLLMAGVIAWRAWEVQGLVFPTWVDSVHHATVIRKMVEVGWVPDSLEPYIEMPFFYHFGFHALTATIQQVGQLTTPTAILLTGQTLQVVLVMALYRLIKVIYVQPRWAWLAVALVTLATGMPGHYTAWGKYPLLAGLALATCAISLCFEISQSTPPDRFAVPIKTTALGVLVAATCLTHTFSALVMALFAGIAVCFALLTRRQCARLLLAGLVAGAGSASPWIIRVWVHTSRFLAGAPPTLGQAAVPVSVDWTYIWQLLGPVSNYWLLLIAMPGIVLSLFDHRLRLFVVWLMTILIGGWVFGSQSNLLGWDRIAIVLFVPITIFVIRVLSFLQGLKDESAPALASLITLTSCMFGAANALSSEPSALMLADQSDAQALAWVQTHTPTQARFLIGVAPWPSFGYRGTDGGWWILPMTGRQTLLPPAIAGLGNSQRVQDTLIAAIRTESFAAQCDAPFAAMIRDYHLSHVYVNLRRNPFFAKQCAFAQRVYASGDVEIYEFNSNLSP